MFLRKEHAGGDSFGHHWTEDGDVVEVTDEQAQILLRQPASDFSIVDEPDPQPDPGPEPEHEPDPEPDAVPEAAAEPQPESRRRQARTPKPKPAE